MVFWSTRTATQSFHTKPHESRFLPGQNLARDSAQTALTRGRLHSGRLHFELPLLLTAWLFRHVEYLILESTTFLPGHRKSNTFINRLDESLASRLKTMDVSHCEEPDQCNLTICSYVPASPFWLFLPCTRLYDTFPITGHHRLGKVAAR
jgi:hypothetical protein